MMPRVWHNDEQQHIHQNLQHKKHSRGPFGPNAGSQELPCPKFSSCRASKAANLTFAWMVWWPNSSSWSWLSQPTPSVSAHHSCKESPAGLNCRRWRRSQTPRVSETTSMKHATKPLATTETLVLLAHEESTNLSTAFLTPHFRKSPRPVTQWHDVIKSLHSIACWKKVARTRGYCCISSSVALGTSSYLDWNLLLVHRPHHASILTTWHVHSMIRRYV